MSFMKLEITIAMRGLMVDGLCGIDYIPADVVDLDYPVGTILDRESNGFDVACETIKDYTENTRIDVIEVVYGHFGRYQAPGYLDCTPWSFDTDPDALEAYLNEFYGDEDEDEDEDEEEETDDSED